MTWYTSGTNQTAGDALHAELVTFVALDFPSGFVRVHSRTGPITWGGNTYEGVGKLGSISDVDEDAQLRPSGVSVLLSGVDETLVQAAITEACHGRPINIWQGYLNIDTLAMLADPQLVFRGLMDSMTVEMGKGTGTITIQCESELARWDRHQGLLYTHESQQALYPGDRFFDQVPFLQTRKIDWRKSNVWQAVGKAAAVRKVKKGVF